MIFEHRTYLPGFGFFLALTGAFFYFFKERYLKIAVMIILMIVSINTVLTYQRNKIWKNEYTLWADCVKKSPNKARVHNGFGLVLFAEGKIEDAIDQYNEAIRITPDYTEAYNNRGMAYSDLGQHQRAIEDYNEAIRITPDYAKAHNNRGVAYATLGQYQRAIENFNEAIRLKPDSANAYGNRGIAYLNQGNKELGCSDAQKACALGSCKLLERDKDKGGCR